jgi:hypothetical protein
VTIDEKAPGSNHEVDTNAEGNGVVMDHRLYQVVRQNGEITEHTFAIEFQEPGVQAFSFTFGGEPRSDRRALLVVEAPQGSLRGRLRS